MPLITGNISFAMTDTISCLLCRGIIGFNEKETSRYEEHLALEHRVVYHLPWIIKETIKEFWNKPPTLVKKDEDVKEFWNKEPVADEHVFEKYQERTDNTRTVSIRPVAMDQVGVKRESIEQNNEELLEDEAMEEAGDDDPLQEGFMKVEEGKLFVSNDDTSIVQEESEGKYQCEACPDVFLNKRTYSRHVKSKHSVDRMFPCKVCGKSFKTKSYVEIHEKKHNLETAKTIKKREKPLQCDICMKFFKTEAFLKNHLENHSHT